MYFFNQNISWRNNLHYCIPTYACLLKVNRNIEKMKENGDILNKYLNRNKVIKKS